MVGITMAADSGETIKSLINCVTFAADNPSKLEYLHQLKLQLLSELQQQDTSFSQFLPSLLKLHTDAFSPVRKCVSEVIGDIGSRHLELLPETIPALLTFVDDEIPAVARQAITSGTSIFCCTLERIAIQGLAASKLDDSLESAWEWMLKLKEKIYSLAFESGSDGIRLLALKFVAAIILIYTPDPNGSVDPPPNLIGDVNGKEMGFNISWLRKGHPILKLGDLSVEASQSLGLLLDQLRVPIMKSLSISMVVVLINCLSAIAVKRPSFYGRILPVLLGLDPSNSVIKGLHAYGVQNALKNAFLSCLKCAHPSSTPWRDRLLGALRELGAGDLAEKALEGVCNINGNVKEEKVVPVAVKEEQSLEIVDSTHNKVGRKRSSDIDVSNRNEDDDTPGKRAKSMHTVSEELSNKSDALHTAVKVKSDSSGQVSMSKEDDLDPVQQLIGLFGALVAQGEKAAASLEILITNISPDLLAEVVITNLRNLPSTCPVVERDELQENTGSYQKKVDSDTPFGQVSLFLTNAFYSSCSGHISSSVDAISQNTEPPLLEDSHSMDVVDNNDACAMSNKLNDPVDAEIPSTHTSFGNLLELEKGSGVSFEFQDVGPAETAIPGLDYARSDGPLDTVASSSLASTDFDDGSQGQVTSVEKRSKESLPSLSTERSEELSSKTAGVDANIGMASTATSLGPVQQFVLPKMSAPVIELSGEDKDTLQKLVFLRIVEAYKQVAVSGGSQLRFSLLSYLGVELSVDLDLWTCLQTHILSDYVNHEGHELTLRVLYRLYGEAEEERDFFSSTTATSVYETFLLKVAETLRDSFPASDKSLSRLFGEVPYLPESSLKLLECLCSPEMEDRGEKESHCGDRITQGLSAVWSLIMLRPTLRDVLLKIALKSAVHYMEEVRMKAIRLVANKLYPLPSISLQIEEFAKEKLLSVVDTHSADAADTGKSSIRLQKNLEVVLSTKDQAPGKTMAMESSVHTSQSGSPDSVASTSVSKAQRCMSLYFALCTKKHGLLRQIFIIFKSSPESVKQAIHSHMPILIRTVGASPSLLDIISDPPAGSEKLLMQVLHTLTDGRVPSAELISTIKKLYETKMKDIEILFPILSFLPKEEVLRVFPQVVNLSQDKFQASLTRLLQGSTPSGPVLTPSEVLIAIHGIDPEKDGIPLKKVTDACNACFEQRQIFTQQVIAKVLNQLVEQIPLPLLFMRTVLQAIGAFPALVDFILEILARLVSKQIWKYPKLWVGFLKCAQLTQPHSFNVLLQLPQAQLEGALNKIPALKAPLAAHANQQNLRSTLPRSVLTVLGIVSDSQAGSQSQSGQSMKIKESSGVASDSQAGSQSKSEQAMKIKESSGVASDSQAEDAASSDKDVVNEKSKESSGGS